MTHPFWGEIKGDQTVASFPIPGFGPAIPVCFANVRVASVDLTLDMLDAYAEVFRSFVAVSESLFPVVQQEAFRYYRRVYAHYFEHPDVSGEPALGLVTAELHDARLKQLLGVVLSDCRSVELDFEYDVDEEHGLAVMFVDNRFHAVGGIADLSPGPLS